MRTINLKPLVLSIFIAAAAVLVPIQTTHAVAQTPITRTTVEQRALKMINLSWTYSKANNSNISSQYVGVVTQPQQLRGITSGQMIGIPYTWGGFDGIDTHSYNTSWSNFLGAVSSGAYIGNVNTDAGYGYIPRTAGLDCSGFVQATFNIKDYKQSTTTLLNNYFTKINLSDIKHMDILDKPGEHVVIFDKWGYRNGIYGAYTYESTPDQTYGGIQGTKQYFISMSEINTGYVAARYKYINEISSASTGSSVKPGIFAQIINVTTYANFRSAPSISSQIISTIPKGTIIYLNSYSNGWYQINYNGKSGWVSGNLIGNIPSGKYVTVVNGITYLNIRINPSVTASILGTLQKGQYAEVLDYSNNGLWMKIKINGITGWASKRSLSYIY